MLSIIIPCYNGEEFIKKCINGILCQTYQHFEILIINDGSADNSRAIIEKLIKSDPRIALLDLKKNIGINKAISIGLKKIKNPYLCIVTIDDPIVSEYFFEKTIKLLQENKECAFVFSDPGNFITKNNKFRILSLNLANKVLKITPEIYKKIMIKRPFHIPTNSIVHRTSLFRKTGFNATLDEKADWVFTIISCLRYNSIYIPGNFVFTRIHHDAYSTIKLKNFSHQNKIISEVYKFLSLKKNKDVINDFIKIGIFPNYNFFIYLWFILNLKNIKYVSFNQLKLFVLKNLWFFAKKIIPLNTHERLRAIFLKKVDTGVINCHK